MRRKSNEQEGCQDNILAGRSFSGGGFCTDHGKTVPKG